MKKLFSLFLALTLLLGVLAVPALAEEKAFGTLSYLNMTEEEVSLYGISVRRPMMKLLFLQYFPFQLDKKILNYYYNNYQLDI